MCGIFGVKANATNLQDMYFAWKNTTNAMQGFASYPTKDPLCLLKDQTFDNIEKG